MNERLSTGKQEEGEKESKRHQREEQVLSAASADMPNFAGTWKMKKSENFDELLKALGKPLSCLLPPSPLSFLHYQLYHPCMMLTINHVHVEKAFSCSSGMACLTSNNIVLFEENSPGKKEAEIYGEMLLEGNPSTLQEI